MSLERSLAAPGLRTDPRPGWRPRLVAALAVVAGQPELWLLGGLSFALRGGVPVLLATMVVLPTQVEVRLMLGSNLGSTGLSSGFWALVASAIMIATGLALAALYGLARTEARAFRLVWTDPELAGETQAAVRVERAGRRTVLDLFLIQALTLIAVMLAALPLAVSVGPAMLDEILRPSSSALIYGRVLGHLVGQMLFLVAALPVIDTLSAQATRRVLRGATVGGALRGVPADIYRAPLRTMATAIAAWLALVGVLAAVSWSLSVAWQAARAAFLATTSIADMLGHGEALVVALMLSAVFVCGFALAGFVAAWRAALWTLTTDETD